MQELRFVAVSEDGSYAVLAVPGRSGRFILSIDERLRAVAMGQTSRLAQYEIEVESPLRPKEIQARIRAGETAEEIADAAGIPVERVRWFEGPVLAERAYIADQAQAASVRRAGDSGGSGSRLGDIVPERLTASGGTAEDGQWDSRKRGDGNWQVTLTFPSGGRLHVAEWVFDPRRRHVMPDDDNAARLSLPESELPPEPVALPGEATVTPLAPRLGAAAGMGGGGFAGGGSGVGVRSFRPERSVIPDRSLGGDRSLADRPATHAPAASAASSGSERPGMPERTGLAHSPAATPVLPRPSYHDHTDFRDAAPEPPAHREPAAGHRASSASASAGAGADGRRSFDATAAEEIVPVTAPPYVFDEPAAAGAVGAAAAADDREQARVAPAREIVFEEPEPAFLDEQLELAPTAPAPAAAAGEHAAPAPARADAAERAEPGPAQPAQAEREAPATPAVAQQATQVPGPGGPESRAAAAAAVPAATRSEPVAPSRPEPAVEVRAGQTASAQSPSAETNSPQTTSPQEAIARVASAAKEAGAATSPAQSADASAGPAEPGEVAASASAAQRAADGDRGKTPAHGQVGKSATESVGAAASKTAVHHAAQTEPETAAEPAGTAGPASSAGSTVTEPASAPEATQAPAPEAARAPAVPAVAAAAAQTEPAAAAKPSPAPEPKPAAAAPDKSESTEEQSTRQRPAAKKNAKGRRSSVPSWDEIMLGSSRQRD